MGILDSLQQNSSAQIGVALENIQYEDTLSLLFDLSVLFEQLYGAKERGMEIQIATTLLTKLIRDVIYKKGIKIRAITEEHVPERLLSRLLNLREKGYDKSLTYLWQSYESLEGLDIIIQIQKYDENCEVKEYPEGCIITRVRDGRFEYFQNYIRDGLKYEALTNYYLNKGRYIGFELVRSGSIVLLGKNEDDKADSFKIIGRQIATTEFLEHYGVEEIFTLNGQEYRTSLLVQILSFLTVYSASRYGYYWEESAEGPDVIRRISGVWKLNAEVHNQMAPGPLYVDSWENTLVRLSRAIGEITLEEIDRHLNFFAVDLASTKAKISLIEKPLLRLDNLVVFFTRPLMYQNSWLPILLPLIKAQGKIRPEKAQERTTASTKILAEKFKDHHFFVWTDLDLWDSEIEKTITDIDIVALKESALILLQIKMTHPRACLKEAKDHRNAMVKAGEQMALSVEFLKKHWKSYGPKLGSSIEWADLKVIPLVVSTSFEYDRERFFGYLKISQFELERYLENDAFLFHLDPDWPNSPSDWEMEYLFYPAGEKLSGSLLKKLIDSNALWQFLEPAVLAKPTVGLLPEFCLPGSRAYSAQECFLEGSAFYQKNDFAQAEKMFQEAIAYFPNYETYYKELGSALAMQGRQLESLKYFDEAIGMAPCNGELYFARGVAFQELGMYDKAHQDYSQAIRFSPQFMPAWLNIVHLQVARGQNLHFKQFLSEAKVLATKGLTIFALLPVEEQEIFGDIAIYLAAISRS